MNINTLEMFFRKDINYRKIIKIRLNHDVYKHKIYIFTLSIVNQLTMYINTNQLITNKPNYNDKH